MQKVNLRRNIKAFLLAGTLLFGLSGCVATDLLDDSESLVASSRSTLSMPQTEAQRNALRPDYDLGECRFLQGDVLVVVFFMNDFESGWDADTSRDFLAEEIRPGLAFLEEQAARFGIPLSFQIETYPTQRYNGEVILDIKTSQYATADVLHQAAVGVGFDSDDALYQSLKAEDPTREVVCLTVFHKAGDAYALNPRRGSDADTVEHCLIFSEDLDSEGKNPTGAQASIVAHELLHLYGAEDFYSTPTRKALALEWYPDDIMLGAKYRVSQNKITDATAFYIGWSDEVPPVLLDESW